MRTKAKLRELMRAPDLDVKSSFEVGEVVYLPRGTTWQRQRKTTCECCDDKGYRTIEKSDHSTSCNRTLNWIVRVTYTTLYGNVAHMDSVRLCMADAARLRVQYGAHVATVRRVYPLRLR